MTKRLVNPRLNDFFELDFDQDTVDFLIPHLQEDIRLYVDPFLLWSSENDIYLRLHQELLNFFEHMRYLVSTNREIDVIRNLLRSPEPREFGLGYSLGSKKGSTIGLQLAQDIIQMYRDVPQLAQAGFNHIEEIGLFVPRIAEDRISDLTVSILKTFFIEFTIDRAEQHKIPTKTFNLSNIYNLKEKRWLGGIKANLPYNPLDESPLMFVPLDILRHLPWINYEDYYKSYFARYVLPPESSQRQIQKQQVLAYNRANFANVQAYVQRKEQTANLCKPDPLFEPLKRETLRRRYKELRNLPTGLENESDKKFESIIYDLLSSMLYPELEFADSQVRTISGTHIRDLLFYNDAKTTFLKDIRENFGARQLVFELKNVKALEREHVNQLERYFDDEFGYFGILVARNPPSRAILRNVVDLHSSKRHVILCLDDSDIELMINLLDSDKRPIDAITKKYVDFQRMLPK